MSAGVGDTSVTVPVPVVFTVSRNCCSVKVAVAVLLGVVMPTKSQVLVPEQSPLHPVKSLPVPGAAVSVTLLPEPKPWKQLVPQLISLEITGVLVLVTVPVPLPFLTTV